MKKIYPDLALVSSQKINNNIDCIGLWCYLNDFSKGDYIGLEWKFYNDKSAKEQLSLLALKYHDSIILHLTAVLNKHHGRSYSKKYWSILLSTSVISVIETVLNKIQVIENNKKYYQVDIFNLNSHPVLSSTRSLLAWLNTDDGTLYILSTILKKSNQDRILVNKSHDFIQQKRSKKIVFKAIKRTILEYFRVLMMILLGLRNGVYIDTVKGIDLKDLVSLKIKYKSKKKIATFKKLQKPIKTSREKIFADLKINNLDEAIIQDILSHTLPTIFFENYNTFEKLCFFPSYLINIFFDKLICGPVLGGNDVSKFILSKCIERQSELIISQHGSNYGTSSIFTTMAACEYKNCDRFISWGWSEHSSYQIKVDSLPSPYLSKLNKNNSTLLTNEIVFVGNNLSVYGDRIASGPGANELGKFFRDKIKFLDHLSVNMLSILRYKPYPSMAKDLINEKSYINSHNNEIIFVENNYLSSSKILIADHPGTIMLERLAMNKPIIIFIDKSIWTFSKQSQFFFDNLFKVNIVHYDPINAANFINLNYNSLDEWWYSIDVQKVVEEFTNSYAKNSDSYSDEWKNYLKI